MEALPEESYLVASKCLFSQNHLKWTLASSGIFYDGLGTSVSRPFKRQGKVKGCVRPSWFLGWTRRGFWLAAVELGKFNGSQGHCLAASNTTEKLDLCKKYGADELINYTHKI